MPVRLSLGTKLSLSLLAFLLLLAAATSAAVLYGFQRAQDNARSTSRGGLEDFGSSVLGSFARLSATSISLEFARAEESARSAARYVATSEKSETPSWDASRLVSRADGIRYDPAPDRLADAWVPNFLQDDPGVDVRLRDASALDPLFGALLENVPNGVAAYFIGAGGEGRYYPPNGVQDIVPADFNLWTVPGFDAVRPDKNPERSAVWTEPYLDSAGQGLIASAIAPVYFDDEFVGVVGIDISLAGLIAEIDGVEPTEHGYAFYVDRGGEILATRHSADVTDALTLPEHASLTEALDRMRAGESGIARTTIAGDEVFVGYAPVEGLGGSIAFVAPVDDIRQESSAAAITDAIAHDGNVTLRLTLAVVGGLYVVALGGATWLNRRVLVRPIGALVQATRSVAGGNLTTEVPVTRGDELGELGGAFNVMVEQLRRSERELEERVATRTRELEALLRANEAMFRSLNLGRVLDALVDVAIDVLAADKSMVILHEGEIDVVRAARNHSPERMADFNAVLATMPHVEPPPQTQKLEVITDIAAAPDFLRIGLEAEGIVAAAVMPIQDSTRMLGTFSVSFVRDHEFTDEELRLYQALADRAAVAIQNAELYERAQQAASLEERQRLARELHDSVSQALYGIALGTRTARLRLGDDPHNAAEPIDYVMSLAQAGMAEMRALIFELRPESLENEGVVAAIEKQVASIRARYQIDFGVDLGEEPACAIEVKEALYRIAQEALHNVVKHAQAQHVDVRLARDGDGALTLTVADDGRGFDAGASFPGHVGLHSMRERAERLGGSVRIRSAPGAGTTMSASIPAGGQSRRQPAPSPA